MMRSSKGSSCTATKQSSHSSRRHHRTRIGTVVLLKCVFRWRRAGRASANSRFVVDWRAFIYIWKGKETVKQHESIVRGVDETTKLCRQSLESAIIAEEQLMRGRERYVSFASSLVVAIMRTTQQARKQENRPPA